MASVAGPANGVSPPTAPRPHSADTPTAQPPSQPPQQPQAAPDPKPRDIRTMELLLTAQGVTAYESRVPQLLLDFAYRHTSAILSDALHLSADPYTTNATGARPVGPSAPTTTVRANAIQLAIASRLAFQFRGGAGDGSGAVTGGGAAKEWLLDLARERNRVALPRVGAVEWGTRLPSERFVLSGVNWGLRDAWAPGAPADDDDEGDEEDDDDNFDIAMGGTTAETNVGVEDVGGDGVEGGTMDDVFEDDGMIDEDVTMA